MPIALLFVAATHAPCYADARDHYQKAADQANINNMKEALAEVNLSIQEDPNSAPSYFLRGQILNRMGETKAAGTDIDRAVQLNPNEPKYKEAQAEFQKVLSDPKYVNQAYDASGQLTHRQRALALWNQRLYAQAIPEFNAAMAQSPRDPVLYRRRGDSLQNLKQFRAAINDYNAVLKLDPTDKYVYGVRGTCFSELRMYPQAMQDFNAAIKLDPSNSIGWDGRGAVYAKLGYNQQALADFNEALKYAPNDDVTLRHRSLVMKRLGQKQAAYSDQLQAAQSFRPELPREFLDRAHLYMNLKQYDLAFADFNKVISMWPDKSDGYIQRADAYVKCGQPAKAVEDLSKAIALNAGASAYYGRGVAQAKLQQYNQAVDDFTMAIKLGMQKSDVYIQRAAAYEAAGKHSLAVKDTEMAGVLGRR